MWAQTANKVHGAQLLWHGAWPCAHAHDWPESLTQACAVGWVLPPAARQSAKTPCACVPISRTRAHMPTHDAPAPVLTLYCCPCIIGRSGRLKCRQRRRQAVVAAAATANDSGGSSSAQQAALSARVLVAHRVRVCGAHWRCRRLATLPWAGHQPRTCRSGCTCSHGTCLTGRCTEWRGRQCGTQCGGCARSLRARAAQK